MAKVLYALDPRKKGSVQVPVDNKIVTFSPLIGDKKTERLLEEHPALEAFVKKGLLVKKVGKTILSGDGEISVPKQKPEPKPAPVVAVAPPTPEPTPEPAAPVVEDAFGLDSEEDEDDGSEEDSSEDEAPGEDGEVKPKKRGRRKKK